MESLQAEYEAGERVATCRSSRTIRLEIFIYGRPEACWHFAVNALGAVGTRRE